MSQRLNLGLIRSVLSTHVSVVRGAGESASLIWSCAVCLRLATLNYKEQGLLISDLDSSDGPLGSPG